jgi:hypothetical protein
MKNFKNELYIEKLWAENIRHEAHTLALCIELLQKDLNSCKSSEELKIIDSKINEAIGHFCHRLGLSWEDFLE